MINWVVHAGPAAVRLRRQGGGDQNRRCSSSRGAKGFWEHYNAVTGEGGGTERLSWTAGLVLDLLDAEHDGEGGGE